jgi:subtilisin-like proprotein convertase family protein
MDAGAMVRLAKIWIPVPEPIKCSTQPGQSGVNKNKPVIVKGGTEQTITLDASNCDKVTFIEHIHLFIDMTSGAKRGDLSVLLRSPGGTVSILLAPRPLDDIRTGFGLFKTWPMMSVHFWGEPVAFPDVGGDWVLLIRNDGDRPAILNDWHLTFYGTEFDPQPGVALRPVFEVCINSSFQDH